MHTRILCQKTNKKRDVLGHNNKVSKPYKFKQAPGDVHNKENPTIETKPINVAMNLVTPEVEQNVITNNVMSDFEHTIGLDPQLKKTECKAAQPDGLDIGVCVVNMVFR